MEALVARLEVCVKSLEKIKADHEDRIRKLENRSAVIAGAIALAVFVIPIILSFT